MKLFKCKVLCQKRMQHRFIHIILYISNLLHFVLPTNNLSNSLNNNILLNGVTIQPDFAEPIQNITVPVGRDAIFQCLVTNLGGYRVGWVKADTKAIQAIHDHVITQNSRISVSHNDYSTWNLHIKSVQEEDRGQYMCQINTDPMKSQVGYLDVVVPPDIIDSGDGISDVLAPEGGVVQLRCRARGHPLPHITWRREDGNDIIIRDGQRIKAYHTYEGEVLRLPRVSRTDMGAYLCIASNGVPPSVSMRFVVNVQFHPLIQVPNQLLGAPLGTDVKLECYVEASPKSINYWIRDSGEMVISSEKYEVKHITKSMFEEHMILTVRNLQFEDVGSYKCVAKNALGEEESSIRIYEIPGPTRKGQPARYDEEDYTGSAEKDLEDELTNIVGDHTARSRDRLSNAWNPDKSSIRLHEPHVSSASDNRIPGTGMSKTNDVPSSSVSFIVSNNYCCLRHSKIYIILLYVFIKILLVYQ